ncbi:CvpA family protein [Alicyclobacillus sp. SO9]|uniref:CvpA family protein n=1 Tax=Alicyclobacillus sp. SO9 TaxID=2665646 RepID=UPI0018E7E053|nr:CvpA family protein [Alicyclobacillus sp. SO9]
MDLLDLIIVIIVALGGWNGYRIGLIRQITRLFGAVLAYFLARWLQPYIAPAIKTMHLFPKQNNAFLNQFLGSFDNAAAFAVVFVISFILLRYGVGLIDTLFQLPVLSTVNRLAGLVAGLIFAIVFVYVGALLASYIQQPSVQYQVHNSAVIQWLKGKTVNQILHQTTHSGSSSSSSSSSSSG